MKANKKIPPKKSLLKDQELFNKSVMKFRKKKRSKLKIKKSKMKAVMALILILLVMNYQ